MNYCKERVYSDRTFSRGRPCALRVKKDGYCAFHHPDALAARQAKHQSYLDAQVRYTNHQTTKRQLQAAVIAAAKAWAVDRNPFDEQALIATTRHLLAHEAKK